MKEMPPSQVRLVSQEAVSRTQIRLLIEVVVDVDRLAEVGQEFLSAAVKQIQGKPARKK